MLIFYQPIYSASFEILFYLLQNIQTVQYIRPRKHTTDTSNIVQIIWTAFYQQQPHKYFNLIISNEILII